MLWIPLHGVIISDCRTCINKIFGVNNIDQLRIAIDDIYPVEVTYNYPPYNHIACAFKFAKVNHMDKPDDRTLTAPGFFEDYDDSGDIDKFDWPDPSLYLDRQESARRVADAPVDRIRMGIFWSAHFQDACSAFGMEQALVMMYLNPDMFRAVIDRITEFYLKANEIFYESTKGKLDAILIGNDFGSQTGLMLEPESLRKFVFTGTKKLIDKAKSYGLIVMHHSCGSVFPLINGLVTLIGA